MPHSHWRVKEWVLLCLAGVLERPGLDLSNLPTPSTDARTSQSFLVDGGQKSSYYDEAAAFSKRASTSAARAQTA